MNERVQQLAEQALNEYNATYHNEAKIPEAYLKKFAELIVQECANREALLGAIARGWCSEKNSHKIMDSDLAVAIFDQVEQQIRQQFRVER